MKVGDQEEQKAPPEPGVVTPYHQDLEKANPPSLKNGLGPCCASEQMLILVCPHPSCFTSSLGCRCLLVQPSKHTCRFCPPLTPAVCPCRFSSGSNRWPPSVPPSVLHSQSQDRFAGLCARPPQCQTQKKARFPLRHAPPSHQRLLCTRSTAGTKRAATAAAADRKHHVQDTYQNHRLLL